MLLVKPVGRSAAARKYDILTGLGAWALARGKSEQRLALRLLTLVTARYNWTREELAVGQREIARLWTCDERTVKREMAKLRAMGWLSVRRQGARGRVTEYKLEAEILLEATRAQWAAVGPDYELRMEVGHDRNVGVVPMPIRGDVPAPDISDGMEWSVTAGLLFNEDKAVYGSWIRAMTRVERAGGRLVLKAPSRFHAAYVQTNLIERITRACRSVDETVSEIVVIV